jgi:hypothetical protein
LIAGEDTVIADTETAEDSARRSGVTIYGSIVEMGGPPEWSRRWTFQRVEGVSWRITSVSR